MMYDFQLARGAICRDPTGLRVRVEDVDIYDYVHFSVIDRGDARWQTSRTPSNANRRIGEGTSRHANLEQPLAHRKLQQQEQERQREEQQREAEQRAEQERQAEQRREQQQRAEQERQPEPQQQPPM